MTTQRYFYKGRDFIQLRRIAGQLITIACAFIMLLLAYIIPGSLLDF
jgi:hypothetical protein